MNMNTCSATVLESVSRTFVTTIPFSVAVGMSMLSTPIPPLDISSSLSAASSTLLVRRGAPRSIALNPLIRSTSSSSESRWVATSTSISALSRSRPS